MKNKKNIPFVFYADDFTGATDELEVLAKSGANVILFVEPPTKEQLKALRNINAIGIASNNRALNTNKLVQKLSTDFTQIKNHIDYNYLHYKICSTFDSAPNVGSIGAVIDQGIKQLNATFIPIIGGHPSLGRYCVFGNLFAKVGTGNASTVFRIDRHPSMKNHPTTPALESDLIEMLGKQTKTKFNLIDWTIINQGNAEIGLHLQQQNEKAKVVLFDAQTVNHINKIGAVLHWHLSLHNIKTFAIGPSSVAQAVGNAFNKRKFWQEQNEWKSVSKQSSTIVFSGSCSVVTQQQITTALQNGFEEIIVKPNEKNIHLVIKKISEIYKNKQQVIIHSGKRSQKKVNPETLGSTFGKIALGLIQSSRVKRIVFAGGDTSSFAAKALGVKALQFKQPYVQGAPICKVVYSNKNINGLELNFKGGQVGDDNYFLNI